VSADSGTHSPRRTTTDESGGRFLVVHLARVVTFCCGPTESRPLSKVSTVRRVAARGNRADLRVGDAPVVLSIQGHGMVQPRSIEEDLRMRKQRRINHQLEIWMKAGSLNGKMVPLALPAGASAFSVDATAT
jgi:hypothetical protein